MCLGLCELRRVEHDQVVLLGFVAQRAQFSERVAHDLLADLDTVQFGVATSTLQRYGRGVEAADTRCPVGGSDHAERAGVREGVEHAPASGVLGHCRASVALIEVEARLLPFCDRNCVPLTALDDEGLGIRHLTPQKTRTWRQVLALACVHIGPLKNAAHAGQCKQCVGHDLAPPIATGRAQLQHHAVAISIGDDTGYAVGLAEHQPCGVRERCEVGAPFGSGRDARGDECIVDLRVGIERPHPSTQLRRRRE